MHAHEISIVRPATGVRSREIAWRLAELDDQLALLLEELNALSPAELVWQSAPGMNTIGMLLAHLAIVEVFWLVAGLLAEPETDPLPVLGIDMDGDGLPLPEAAAPPASLASYDLAMYRDLLTRARAYLAENLRERDEAWLDQIRTRVPPNGSTHQFEHRRGLY